MDADVDEVVIRRLRADEGPMLRDLRLRSLADAPDAFGQTLAESSDLPMTEWRRSALLSSRGDSRAWFIALTGTDTVGVVQGRRRRPDTLLIFSMWVDQDHRRQGVGRRLIDAAEGWAAGWKARTCVLWVFAGNNDAIEFYRRLGFGLDSGGEDALAGARYGAVAMRRSIDVQPARRRATLG